MKKVKSSQRIPITQSKVLLFCTLLLIGCSQSNQSKDELITIDLEKAIENAKDVKLSLFVESLEYIPLELTPESTISGRPKISMTDEYIIVRTDSPVSNSLLLLFDKHGKFIRPLGKKGRGPGEYTRPLDQFYNPYDRKIYAHAGSSINTYDLEGVFLESFDKLKIEEAPGTDSYVQTSLEAYMNADTCIYYLDNSTGSINKRLIIATKNNEIRSFPQYQKWSTNDVSINQDPIFFSWENKLSFKERSNDTVFYISKDKLIPRLVLYSANKRYPYKLLREEAIEQMTQPKDYFETFNIFENSKFLFFDVASKNMPLENKPGEFKVIRNLIIFDKTTENLFVCNDNSETDNPCLIDDINNFVPIMPESITNKNELTAVIEAVEIEKWKKTNPQNLAAVKEMFPWLENMNELSNPIIVIGKFK